MIILDQLITWLMVETFWGKYLDRPYSLKSFSCIGEVIPSKARNSKSSRRPRCKKGHPWGPAANAENAILQSLMRPITYFACPVPCIVVCGLTVSAAFDAVVGVVVVLSRRTCDRSGQKKLGNTPGHSQSNSPLLKLFSPPYWPPYCPLKSHDVNFRIEKLQEQIRGPWLCIAWTLNGKQKAGCLRVLYCWH